MVIGNCFDPPFPPSQRGVKVPLSRFLVPRLSRFLVPRQSLGMPYGRLSKTVYKKVRAFKDAFPAGDWEQVRSSRNTPAQNYFLFL